MNKHLQPPLSPTFHRSPVDAQALSRNAPTRPSLSPWRIAEPTPPPLPGRPCVPENGPRAEYVACGIPPGHNKNYHGRPAWGPPPRPRVLPAVYARNWPDAVCPNNANSRLGDKLPPFPCRISQTTQIRSCPPGNTGASSLRSFWSHSEMGGMAPAKQAFAGVPFLRLFEGHLRLSITHRETNRRFYPRFASPCSAQ